MSRIRTLIEWSLICIPFVLIGIVAYVFLFSPGTSGSTSGLPDNGGFFQDPLPGPQVYSKATGNWAFTLTSRYNYTLAGKVVGRHEFLKDLPDGIIALDLAVANGDLLKNGNLRFFTFTMGDHTLQYSYDVPNYTGLTEGYIDEHISNNHLVFLDPALESAVKGVETGDCLVITGKLVDIKGTSGQSTYLGTTSTVRNDEYPAGCEVILVESFTPVPCGA